MRRRTVVIVLVVCAAGGALVVASRGRGITSGRQPFPGETMLARAAWRHLVPRAARDAANPVPSTPAVLEEAMAHWADHCAVCHGSDGRGNTQMSRHMFPPVPDLSASSTQGLTDGEIFYATEQGIPWSAMPAWSIGTDEGARESWALVNLIRDLPHLSADDISHIDAMTPRSAADIKREQEGIDQFLNPPPTRGRRGR